VFERLYRKNIFVGHAALGYIITVFIVTALCNGFDRMLLSLGTATCGMIIGFLFGIPSVVSLKYGII